MAINEIKLLYLFGSTSSHAGVHMGWRRGSYLSPLGGEPSTLLSSFRVGDRQRLISKCFYKRNNEIVILGGAWGVVFDIVTYAHFMKCISKHV